MNRPGPERRSLFGEILDWMLAPLLLIWPMSVALTWLVAQGIANRPFDRELDERVRAIAQQLANEPGPPPLHRDELAESARWLLSSDASDGSERYSFQALGWRGEFVAGDAELSVPGEGTAADGQVRFRDDTLRGEPVRVAWLWLPADGPHSDYGALVQVAETLDRRKALATEIIKGVILPQFAILPLAVLLTWLALSRGIRPLAELQQRIRRRASSDLSPIDERGVPDEVTPLVDSINDLLQRLDQSIATQRHFLADAAHQLKTPLAGLRMQAELAVREIDRGRGDAASMKHSLEQIALSSERAAHMVNQLLAMARAEDREQALRKEPTDLVGIVREAVHDFVPKAIDKRIDLGFEGPPDGTAAALVGHPLLLREMTRNLIDNALQYTPTGGTVTVRVDAAAEDGSVALQVEDTGPGIAEAERSLVFQPFYRALGTQVDGSGLGLAIVAEVAQQHGAQITLEDARSREGPEGAWPGARFTVRFARRQ